LKKITDLNVSKETKVGILAALSITLLILGYSYMKGEDLFTKSNTFYAVYGEIDGLTASNPVTINGFKVGQVKKISIVDGNLERLIVRMEIDTKIKVTKNSIARIYNADLFGSKGVELVLDKSSPIAEEDDTLQSDIEMSIGKSMSTVLNPVKAKTEQLLVTLDSVLASVDDVLNDETQRNLRSGFKSLAETLENFRKTSVKVNDLVDAETKRLDQIFAHVESITRNLRENNATLTKTMRNVNQITDSLAATNLKATVENANSALVQLDSVMRKINKGDGTMGLLVNDKKLYDNLSSSSKNLDALLLDMKAHPKRYVHFSIFGKKDKSSESK
jgi:phospholipid/cholesterol/gamma-HCH transport system substrate-binding protein